MSTAPDEGGDDDRIEVASLPESVRRHLVGWAALVLGTLPPVQIPPALHRVARFTPAKRARLGAAALLSTIDSDLPFRATVAEYASALPSGPDPAAAAARAVLLNLPERADLLAAAQTAGSRSTTDAQLTQLQRQVVRLTRQVEQLTRQRDALAELQSDRTHQAELDKLRGRLREQGTRVRAAELAAAAAQDRLVELAARLDAEQIAVQQISDSWQQKLRAAEDRAERAQRALAELREAAGRDRAAADRRLELLLGTIEGAAAGLRREWDLVGGGADPADVVARSLPAATAGERTADPARLTAWLQLPGAHLIVDGYNVSKTGYPELSLADQRDRLVRAMSALGARTSAEITVVFDGAAVTVPPPPGRRVRVLFSPAGVIADDVIRQLVGAEPAGRVVVVVTSDRAVVSSVGARGARTAGSPTLLSLLA